ncbi:hypothetical protein VP150E351_P0139 [Vibrio phage 150E35-1]|nr:hypothetical protein VP150E351_P0139 [Vibrio phage 150E35-1]
MNTELANMSDIQEKIKEQVKVMTFNLLPDDKFEELVKGEIDAFFDSEVSKYQVAKTSKSYTANEYELTTSVSPFRMMVWTELNKVLKGKLTEVLEEPAFVSACLIDEPTTKGIQDEAMSRQERIAVSMAQMMFQNQIAEALRMASYDTQNDIHTSLNNMHHMMHQ